MLISKAMVEEIEKVSKMDAQVFTITAYAKDSDAASAFAKKYKDDKQFSYQTLGSVLDQISSLTDIITFVLVFVAALSLVVATVMIAIVLYIGVIQRTREIGTLRAIGYTKKNIL